MFSNPNLFDAPRQSTKQPSFSNQSTLFDQNRSFTQTSGNNRDTSYLEDNNNNFKVIVRVRPALPRELESGQITSTIQVNNDNKRVTLYEYYNIDAVDPSNPSEYLENTNMYTTHNFTFDTVYPQNSTQGEVYEGTAKPAVMSVLQGYNATILAYGQTGTGKTYSMEGFNFDSQDSQKGIIPRSMEEIFKYIENVSNSRTTFMVRVSYLQIYNEVVSDLLRTDRSNLQIREDKKKGVFVEGLSEWAVRSPNEIYSLIQKGALSRATAATKMNDVSSRSHAVFIIIVEQMVTSQDEDTGEELKEIRVGKLNLVDLAGSERVRVTGATGKRLEESKKINQSLSALGNVISALADQKQSKTHIPYRDSKITRLLEDSLGGNCITTMMAMVSPIFDSFSESLSTLKFANRAKNIKNAPIINEDVDQKALLRKYEAELKKLRAELENKNKMHHDKKNVSQLEEDKRRAERDKLAAFEALEAQSKEFIHEREEKKKLEEKIGAMFSQMLVGGKKIEETPQFRNAVEQQQKIIRQQYDQKLQDLEKERQMIEEDKAQVDRYKQLLLKQRDIMIALTTRLNERDETIVQLQEELDEYDRVHRDTEEQLQVRDKRVFELATALKENNIPLPSDYKEETEITGPVLSHLSDTNTNNMAANNVNQCEVVESLQMQSDAKTAQLVVSLESQLSIALERARKAEEEQMKLREKLAHKDELLKSVQQQVNTNASTTAKTDRIMSVHKEIKANVDYIIESLSSQNEPQRLQDIARDLLNLQKLVNSAVIVTNSESSSPRDSPSKTASRSGRTIQPVEVKSAGIPPVKGLDTTISEITSEGKEHPRSVSVTPLNNEEPVEQRNSATRHAPSRSTSGEMPKINQVQLKEQSENVVKSQTVQPSPLRGAAKPGADGKAPENKRTISTGIFGKYMGNLVNLDPERKPMTVEDLAKAKKDQPVKKKV